jgi:outer membrane immunogenic protein
VAAAAAATSGAMAADMSSFKALPPAPVVSGWQGFYLGASLGASWLHSVQDDTAAVGGTFFGYSGSGVGGASSVANGMGWLGGLNLGYNLQSGNFVYGAEADFSWLGKTSASSNATFSNQYAGYSYRGTTGRSSQVKELATFRARFGIDFNGTLPYLTAGVALGNIQNSFTITGGYTGVTSSATVSNTSWVPGIVLGGGIEHKLSQNWTLRGEIMWVGFADKSLNNPLSNPTYFALTSSGGPVKFSNELTIGKIGLNYRF